MKGLLTLILFLSLGFACTESGTQIRDISTPSSVPESSISQLKRWEVIYFPAIDERLQDSGVSNLRELGIDGENSEIRLWFGFDTSPTRGILIEHDKNKTSFSYLRPLDSTNTAKEPMELSEPLSGANRLWNRLNDLEIFILPDPLDIAKIDGGGYPTVVVEVKNKNGYRNYKYSGVGEVQSPNHKRVLEICTLIFTELGIDPTKYTFPN